MATLDMGREAFDIVVRLRRGETFLARLDTFDGSNWPTGTSFELRFSDGTVWAATVTGPSLHWSEVPLAVNTLIAAGVEGTNAQLWNTSGYDGTCWGEGKVVVAT